MNSREEREREREECGTMNDDGDLSYLNDVDCLLCCAERCARLFIHRSYRLSLGSCLCFVSFLFPFVCLGDVSRVETNNFSFQIYSKLDQSERLFRGFPSSEHLESDIVRKRTFFSIDLWEDLSSVDDVSRLFREEK